MGQRLSLAALLGLGGCSLIYNPNNLPAPPGEAGPPMPDAEIILDADPTKLEVASLFPTTVDEGAGIDNSRPAIIEISGMQIVPGAQVSIKRTDTMPTTVTVDNTKLAIAADGRMLAIPITIPVDTALGPMAGTLSYTLDVTVTQAGGIVTKTLIGALTVKGYDELTANTVTAGAHQYSMVNVSGGVVASPGAAPAVIRSNSSIKISAAASANGTGNTAGPGGSAGGPSGMPGMGPSPGLAGGGGGGFATAGGKGTNGGSGAGGAGNTGVPSVHSFDTPNKSSGGGGGTSLTGSGGLGGGGGGTIELTAGGNVELHGVTANGGAGAKGGALDTDGGGGSGGVVLVRVGGMGTLTAPDLITVAGGSPFNAANGGKGGDGRIRLDAPTVPAALNTGASTVYRGPMFFPDTPLITRDPNLEITVTCESNKPISYVITDESTSTFTPAGAIMCGGSNQEKINFGTKQTPLTRGINQVCMLVDGATQGDNKAEGRNCINIAYLYTP